MVLLIDAYILSGALYSYHLFILRPRVIGFLSEAKINNFRFTEIVHCSFKKRAVANLTNCNSRQRAFKR